MERVKSQSNGIERLCNNLWLAVSLQLSILHSEMYLAEGSVKEHLALQYQESVEGGNEGMKDGRELVSGHLWEERDPSYFITNKVG